MELRIRELAFENFRNYPTFSLENVGNLTIFIGPNASGKTNALEGIALLTAFASFRNPHARELMRTGCDYARISARFVSDARDLEVSSLIREGSRVHALNGKRKTAQQIQGILPSVSFSPDDLSLVKGAHSLRRAELDLIGCQLSKNHRILKRDYERIIRHKNALLRDEASDVLIESVNDMLIPTATQLFLYRQALFANLRTRMQEVYRGIVCGTETIDASYVPSWLTEDEKAACQLSARHMEVSKEEASSFLATALRERFLEERVRRRSVVGPHADHVELFVDGKNASMFASQGQQRSLVLAWKIGEVGLVRELLGVKPVLLLDDVMSELDSSRRHALVELLRQDIQTFITTTDTAFFEDDIVERADIVDLSKGVEQ